MLELLPDAKQDKLLSSIVHWIGHCDEQYYDDRLTMYSYTKIERDGGLVFAGRDYTWLKKNDLREGNMNLAMDPPAGPSQTARMLVKYKDDKNMMYTVWLAAFIHTIENDLNGRMPDEWCGEPARLLLNVQQALRRKYSVDLFQYHHACRNVFPGDVDTDIYAPATNFAQLGGVVANVAYTMVTQYTVVIFEYYRPIGKGR